MEVKPVLRILTYGVSPSQYPAGESIGQESLRHDLKHSVILVHTHKTGTLHRQIDSARVHQQYAFES